MGEIFAKGELAGVRVLVVDDEEDIREMIAAFLDFCGMNVRTAGSGDEAFQLFQVERPEIVVSDIGMTHGSGLDLVRRIRALPVEEGGLTPAIAVSGDSSPRECFEAGYHFHFAKPLEPLVLIDAIRDFVRSEKLGKAKWSVSANDADDLVLRFEGHVSGTDMHAAVANVPELLEQSRSGYRVIVDLRKLTGFDPSVGAVAQAVAWKARAKLRGALIVGGSRLSHLVALSSCLILGIRCEFADSIPVRATWPIAQ